ncbi:hypothetical protein HY411_03020 [Candidatus Gottesmanbacteria bacterium]|nr:hypothetical protein [Candidatus Gottesmanbacteria bacterium]
MRQPHKDESGQIVLVTLLTLTVVTTIVLSLIGRTTTDVSISNQIEESTRAFNAAEAGIEEALKSGTTGTFTLAGLSYTIQQYDIGGSTGIYSFPRKTTKGSVETLWLVEHDEEDIDGDLDTSELLDAGPYYTVNTIDLCWSSETVTPAVVVGVYYKTAAGEYRVAKGAYDPEYATRGNNFSGVTASAGGCGAETGTTYRQTIDFTTFLPSINPASDIVLFLRIQPLYSDTKIVVNAPATLPLQGKQISSSGTSTGGITRKIVVYRQFRTPPLILDHVIYSQGSLGH